MNLSTTPQADLFVDFFDTYEDEKAQEILSAAHKAIAKAMESTLKCMICRLRRRHDNI